MPDDARRHQTALRDKLPQMLALLERLVNTDSGSYCKAGVNEVGALLSEELARTGFAITRHPMQPCGGQVDARLSLKGKGRLLVLGHMDTVWPEGAVAHWRFAQNGGTATGPGVGDMKGGVVMAIFALRELLAAGFDTLESIRFFLVPDEELGSIHSRPAIEAAARQVMATVYREAFVFEAFRSIAASVCNSPLPISSIGRPRSKSPLTSA